MIAEFNAGSIIVIVAIEILVLWLIIYSAVLLALRHSRADSAETRNRAPRKGFAVHDRVRYIGRRGAEHPKADARGMVVEILGELDYQRFRVAWDGAGARIMDPTEITHDD